MKKILFALAFVTLTCLPSSAQYAPGEWPVCKMTWGGLSAADKKGYVNPSLFRLRQIASYCKNVQDLAHLDKLIPNTELSDVPTAEASAFVRLNNERKLPCDIIKLGKTVQLANLPEPTSIDVTSETSDVYEGTEAIWNCIKVCNWEKIGRAVVYLRGKDHNKVFSFRFEENSTCKENK